MLSHLEILVLYVFYKEIIIKNESFETFEQLLVLESLFFLGFT